MKNSKAKVGLQKSVSVFSFQEGLFHPMEISSVLGRYLLAEKFKFFTNHDP
jgi:hypothetical protein